MSSCSCLSRLCHTSPHHPIISPIVHNSPHFCVGRPKFRPPSSPSLVLMLRSSSLLVKLVLVLPPRLVHCQSYESSSNDPPTNNICIDESGVKYTGHKATRDCRGYVYCNEGVSAGVISCWPNQLYDAVSGVCTYWQNVNAASNACPDLDGTMMMPEITDSNANELLFYCGVSASNARSVCEPCPGGSRLECSDLSHNCFAGITGCKSTNTDADTANDEESPPTFSIMTITNDEESSYTEPSDITRSPSLSPEQRNAQDGVILQTTNPTPNVPESAESTLSLPPLTGTQVESSQSTTIIMDQQQLLCASTKDELELTCDAAPSCAITICPSQMFCFAFTCNNNTEAVLTTTAESTTVATSSISNISSSIIGGEGAEVVMEDDDVGTMMYLNPLGNIFFCSETSELLQSTKICLMSKPCPSGIATNSCVAHEGCFLSSSCAAQYESAAVDAPIHHLLTTKPSMQPHTIEPLMTPSFVQPSVHHIPTTLLTTSYPSGLSVMIPVSVVDASLPQESTSSPFIIQSTTSPSTVPISLSPTKKPTINTNYCGVTWDDHTRNCDVATLCPKGDECPSGETCFSTSPCGILNKQDKDEDSNVAVSNVGSFCSKEWNILLSMCITAARCPIGDECATDEFCYRDFVCDPPPQHTSPPTISSLIIVSPSTALSVTVDVLYPHTVIDTAQQYFCASTKEELETSCSSAQSCNNNSCESGMFCFAFTCTGEVLVSSDDKSVPTSLPTNSAISTPNNNFQTWQSDSVIAAGHKPPKKPCDLCSLNGISFYMKSEVEVSHEGVTRTCSQVYHLLYTRREESSGHCIDAQRKLFKQCCVRTGTILSSSPTTMAATTPAATTNASTSYNSADFETWYTGASMTSASSSTIFTCSLLLMAVWLFALLDRNNN